MTPTTPEAPVRGFVILADGTAASYLEAGDPDGPAVLFLHGLGYAATAWRHQLAAPELAGYRLVALDLRGHGLSTWRPEDDFGGETWAADIDAVITRLGLAPVTIVAWSYAGLVVADYLRLRGPGAVRGLDLVAAAVRAGFEAAWADFGAGALPPGLLSDDPVESARGDALFVAESAGAAGFDDAASAELAAIVGGTEREVLRRLLGRVADNADLWATVSVPTLLSHGTLDRINLPVISERQVGTIAGAVISRYDGVGHLPFWEDPARFNAELLRLLG